MSLVVRISCILVIANLAGRVGRVVYRYTAPVVTHDSSMSSTQRAYYAQQEALAYSKKWAMNALWLGVLFVL